jgi:exodeoxyribonuclease VII large subunit
VLAQRQRGLAECRRRLERGFEATAQRITAGRLDVDRVTERMRLLSRRGLRERQSALESRDARLTALGPDETLKRGYSICLDSAGSIVRRPGDTAAGHPITVKLAAGRLEATVDETVP